MNDILVKVIEILLEYSNGGPSINDAYTISYASFIDHDNVTGVLSKNNTVAKPIIKNY